MGYLAVSHLILVALSYFGAVLLRISHEDRVSVLYAAPQKTLAMGVPLLSLYFSGNLELLGVAILPLLFYHPFQLLTAGVIKGSPLVRPPGRAETSP
jgi:predicted Na+-dependent transporter